MTEQSKEPLIDNMAAPDLFATEAVSFAVLARSNVGITFASSRWNNAKGQFQKVVVARVVLPIPSAQGLAIALNDFLSKQGLDPSAAATHGLSEQ